MGRHLDIDDPLDLVRIVMAAGVELGAQVVDQVGVGDAGKLRDQGRRYKGLNEGEAAKLQPLTETGGGQVQDKEKILLAEILAKVNDLFEGELTDDDKLVYLHSVIKGKLLESEILGQQAANNTKEQFANSPDLATELMNAFIDAFEAHGAMSKQALGSEKVRTGMKDALLGPAKLYEALRARREQHPS